jgi:septal ring factor EnvC (AmiA/AmiB activator)
MCRAACLTSLLVLALAACNGEKRRLMDRLAQLEQQHAAVARKMDQRRNAIAGAERRLATLNADLTAHNTEVHAFLAGHTIALACIRASRSSWGSDSAFEADISATARFGTVLCGVALLNDEFAREVAHVTDRLRQADARVKELKEQMAAARRTIENERAERRRDEDAGDAIAAEMTGIRRQLSGQ